MNTRVVALFALAAAMIAGVYVAVDRLTALPPRPAGGPAVQAANSALAAPAQIAPTPPEPTPAVKAPPAAPQAQALADATPPAPSAPPIESKSEPVTPSPLASLPHAQAPAPAESTPAPAAAPPPDAMPATSATASPVPDVTPAPSATASPAPDTAPATTPAESTSAMANGPPASASEPPAASPQPDKTQVASLPPAPAPPPVVAPPPSAVPKAQQPQVASLPSEPVVSVPALPPEKPEISKKEKEKGVPAKFLFASKKLPSTGKSQAIGYYPRGCIQGAVELPINGPTWQVMRLSRNRNWGHPSLVRFLERFSRLAAKATGWHGILVGDLGQPRGGPLPFGHMSHQIGLDVDIWYVPMPDHRLSRKEREEMSAFSLVAADKLHLNPKTWTPAEADFIRTAAEQPEVQRVLVNAVIKKELCRLEGKNHWSWLAKVRPWYGHADHIHVRLKCPAGSPHCRPQAPVPGGDGCGAKELAFWFSDRVLHPKPSKGPAKPSKQVMLSDLPAACKQVLDAPAKNSSVAGK